MFGEQGGSFMKKLQNDKKTTKQIRIDAGWHQILKVRASNERKSIRALLEEILGDYIYVA